MASKRHAHYVLSSHWDREWYQPLQEFRYRLVQLLDRVVDGLVEGQLRGPFQTDGQAIILEDYLEIRPERRKVIETLASAGKLVIGPWYVMPDEFLVSGEALIRNIRLGRSVARSFGGTPSSAGFICDLFGHNSQMPQILAGFGVRGAFIWRGDNHAGKRHMLWRGADGTALPCYRFGRRGYCTFAGFVRHCSDPTVKRNAAEAESDILNHIQEECQHTDISPILLFDGGDHIEWDPAHYELLTKLMDRDDLPVKLIHSSLDDYLSDMLAHAHQFKDVVEGELREPAKLPGAIDEQWLIPGVLSSRVNIKQANAECQNLLCQWAEPFSTLAAAMLNKSFPQSFLDVAWKWLLQNHPHDSICGCSIDQVHQDMLYRFSQTRQIGEKLTVEATRAVAAAVGGDIAQNELRVVVFNPVPQTFAGSTELTLQIPVEWPTFNEFFGFESKPAFRIFDAAGREIPYQRLNQAPDRLKVRIRPTHFPQGYKTCDVRVALDLNVPGMGYATLNVKPGEAGIPIRYAETAGLATSERSMGNEYLDVTIESNGTLTLRDKKTGHTYSHLMTYEDIADIGDGWYHGAAVNDELFVSSSCHSTVSLVHNGPTQATFKIRTPMQVPAEFRFDRMVRSTELATLTLESTVTLRKGARHLEIQTTIHNTASDHRVRVLFPTGADAKTYFADSPFDAVERPIALGAENHTWRELEVETKPQQSWTAVWDQSRGLAVVSVGQPESAVRDLPDRPIALTLFRGTRRTVMTDGQPEGQLLGLLSFKYWIAPVQDASDIGRLFTMSQQISGGLRTVQLRQEDQSIIGAGLELPATAGMLNVPPPMVATSFRQLGNGIELRLFNPTALPVEADIAVGAKGQRELVSATPVDFESNPKSHAVAIKDGILKCILRPKEIQTLLLR